MMMIMEENNVENFARICNDFVTSSKELLNAAMLCDGDPVKQEMISFIIPDFEKMRAKSEGISLLLYSEDFGQNREFVLQEMEQITKQNFDMATKIKNKLQCLN